MNISPAVSLFISYIWPFKSRHRHYPRNEHPNCCDTCLSLMLHEQFKEAEQKEILRDVPPLLVTGQDILRPEKEIKVTLGAQVTQQITYPTIATGYEIEYVKETWGSQACRYCGDPDVYDDRGRWCCSKAMSDWLRICHDINVKNPKPDGEPFGERFTH